LHSDVHPNIDDDSTSEQVIKSKASASPDRKRSSSSATGGSPAGGQVGNGTDMVCLPVGVDEGTAKDGREEGRKMMKMTKSPADVVVGAASGGGELKADSTALVLVSRRRRWANLLKERPTDLGTMDKWVSNVVFVSDPRSPMPAADALVVDAEPTPPKPAAAAQESRWARLFEQRPAAEEGDAAATKWLVRVLQTSCTEQRLLDEAIRQC
jgi:hypothetical protein